jgi:subtilisin family serine protease
MSRYTTGAILLAALLLLLTGSGQAQVTDPYVVFVKIDPDLGTDLDSLAAANQLIIVDRFDPAGISLLQSQTYLSAEQLVVVLEDLPPVLYAELTYYISDPEAQQKSEGFVDSADPDWMPSSGQPANYFQQAVFQQLQLAGAQQFLTGAGQTIAVIDNGIDFNHPALAGRIKLGPALPYDFIDGDLDPSEVPDGEAYGHGTFVSSVVLMTAPDAKVFPIRALNGDGIGNSFAIAAALYYAVGAGADAINLSVGMPLETQAISEAVYNAIDAGIPVVCPTGNAGTEASIYPAAYDGVFAVTAVDSLDIKPDYANYGDWVTLAAPGENIYAAMPDSAFGWWSGTSFACAYVSGTVGLLLSGRPGSNPAQLQNLLGSTAEPIDQLNPDYAGLLGSGRLSCARAVTTMLSIQGIGPDEETEQD